MRVRFTEIARAGVRAIRPDDEAFQASLTQAIKLHLSRIDVVFDSIPLRSTGGKNVFFWTLGQWRVIWQGTETERIVWSVKPLILSKP